MTQYVSLGQTRVKHSQLFVSVPKVVIVEAAAVEVGIHCPVLVFQGVDKFGAYGSF